MERWRWIEPGQQTTMQCQFCSSSGDGDPEPKHFGAHDTTHFPQAMVLSCLSLPCSNPRAFWLVLATMFCSILSYSMWWNVGPTARARQNSYSYFQKAMQLESTLALIWKEEEDGRDSNHESVIVILEVRFWRSWSFGLERSFESSDLSRFSRLQYRHSKNLNSIAFFHIKTTEPVESADFLFFEKMWSCTPSTDGTKLGSSSFILQVSV